MRRAPCATTGEFADRARRHVDRDEIAASAPTARRHQPQTISVPIDAAEIAEVARQLTRLGTVGTNQVHLVPTGALRDEGDPVAVGRPAGEAVGHLGNTADRLDRARLNVDHTDLALSQVFPDPKDVGDRAAIGRNSGSPLIAVVGTADRQTPRKRVGDIDDGKPRCLVVTLDADDQPVVAKPDRRSTLDQAPRWPSVRRHDPNCAFVAVRHLRTIGRQNRLRVLPKRRGDTASRQAPWRRLVEIEQPNVGGIAVLDKDRGLAIVAERQAPRALCCHDALETPVRRRHQVLADLRGNALKDVCCDPHRICLSHRACPPRAQRLSR